MMTLAAIANAANVTLKEYIMIGWLRFQMNDASVWGYFLQALPISLIAGIVYAVVRFIKGKRKDRPIRLLNETIKFLFVCYLTGLISLVVLPVNFWLNIYDGIFLGWWNEIPSIFSFGGFNLVPTIGRDCYRKLGKNNVDWQRCYAFTIGILSTLCYGKG